MPAGTIIFDGNSMTEGRSDIPYPTRVMTILGNPAGVSMSNFGVGGQTITQMLADAVTQVDAAFSAGPTNIVVPWEMKNELYFGSAAIHAYNKYVRYCTQRRARGFTVIALSETPRSEAGLSLDYEANRQLINGWMRANWTTFADAFVDLGADPILGPPGAELNTTYFDASHVHLGNNGDAYLAALVANAIRPFLK